MMVMVLSNTQSLFWIWAPKLLLWRRFDFAFLGQKKKTEMGMVDFSFSSQKVWNLDVSISSRIMRFVCKISLSLLETRENIFGFLFSSRNWRKCLKFLHFFGKNSRSLLEPENRSRHFSFLFSKFNMDSIFLFSISLVGISSIDSNLSFLADPGVSGVRSVGPGVSMSLSSRPFWNFADVTLADDDTNSIQLMMPI